MAQHTTSEGCTIESESSYQLQTPSPIHLSYRTIAEQFLTPNILHHQRLTRNAFNRLYENPTMSSCSTLSDQGLGQQNDP